VLPGDSAQSTSQKNQIPCSRPDDVIYRPDAQLSKESSVRTTRTFHPDLPLCREALNCCSLHSSGHFKSTSERYSVFDQLWNFLPKHKYEKIATNVRTLSSIRQYRIQNLDIRTPVFMVRTCELLIWKLCASDQPSGRPFYWSRHAKP
jgi:hypothetical protein